MARITLLLGADAPREDLAALLEGRGHHTLVLDRLSDAESVRDEVPDLVIADTELGGGCGLEAVARVRRVHDSEQLPIVLLVPGRSEGEFRRGYAAGADDCLAAETPYEVILAKVTHLLEQIARPPVGPTPPPEPGQVVLDRYRIDALLGRGSYGAVYRADDAERGQPVALKLLDSLADHESRERFMREAYALGAVTNPHVAQVFDFGDRRGTLFCAMELIEGPSVLQKVRGEGACSEPELLGFMRAMADGLAAVHGQALLHRDIKPANIILRGGSYADPVLVDFGLAKGTFDSAITSPDIIMGTPGYLAPEVLERDPDERSDLFSFGQVALFAAAGEEAFAHLVGPDLLQAMAREPVPIPHHLSDRLRRVLGGLVAISPRRRIPSAWELCSELEEPAPAPSRAVEVFDTSSRIRRPWPDPADVRARRTRCSPPGRGERSL